MTSADEAPLAHQAWQRCAARLLPHLSTEESTQMFQAYVYSRYTESQRYYHNVRHLEEMLGHLATYEREHGWKGDYAPALSTETDASHKPSAEAKPDSPSDAVRHDWTGTVLLLSILFHDVVYDPTRGDNEEKSAELAQEFLNKAEDLYNALCGDKHNKACDAQSQSSSSSLVLWTDAVAAQFVREATNDFILKTKVHLSVEPEEQLRLSAPPTHAAVAACHDDPLHVFLDLDLSILGHPDARVYRERYAANIQREYSHHPPADFLKGRAAFLNGFLKKPQWYKTPYFFVQLEAQARRNTGKEVAELTAQLQELESASAPLH